MELNYEESNKTKLENTKALNDDNEQNDSQLKDADVEMTDSDTGKGSKTVTCCEISTKEAYYYQSMITD